MANRKIEPAEKIALLEKQQQEIADKLKREKAKIRQAEKDQRDYRYRLAGKLALDSSDPDFREAFRRILQKQIKPADRALFDLPPSSEPETPPHGQGT